MEAKIERLSVSAYKVPTESPESDGTLAWGETVLVLVIAESGSKSGLGFTYADASTARLIADRLRGEVEGGDAMDVPALWTRMVRSIRNLGRPGICSMAMAAVDMAVWDLKARLLELPLASLLGKVRNEVPIYGSGGFTSYPVRRLQKQLANWVEQGITRVKMKVGREPREDPARVRAARAAIGEEAELFVDANGGYSRQQARSMAERFAEFGVSWFEEPVISDDLEGLREMRESGLVGMEIAAGEYGYDLNYFERMMEARAVDVLQADITRCAGITEFLRVAAVCSARHLPLSAHCAPAMHLHTGCAVGPLRHLEYFYDHARIEQMFFDGIMRPEEGCLAPDLSRPGHGLEFREKDARPYEI